VAQSFGEIENIKNPAGTVIIFGLGWNMPTGQIETIDADNVTTEALNASEDELETLIAAGDIEIRSETGIVIQPGSVAGWVNSVPIQGTNTAHTLTLTMDKKVPSSGESWFKWGKSISILKVKWPINSIFTLTKITLGVDKNDPDNTFGVRLYDGADLNSPVFSSGTILQTNQTTANFNVTLPEQHPSSSYAWSCYRTTGTKKSKFKKIVMGVFYIKES